MIVLIVRLKSGLSEEDMMKVAEDRADRFRAAEGLLQKYYLRYPAGGEYGAVYLWESEKALEKFRASDLFATIAESYKVQGTPDAVKADVIMTLRPN
jgi:heme-degrading monooxygenase HmoA